MNLEKDEFNTKLSRIYELIDTSGLKAVLLGTQTNFLWITGGKRNDVLKNTDLSLVYLLLDPKKKFLISTNSDANTTSEILKELDFELIIYDWETENILDVLKKILGLSKIGSDIYLQGLVYINEDLAKVRKNLTIYEVERIKKFGIKVSELLTDFSISLRPGLSEIDIANMFIIECIKNNIRANVVLVGSDERINTFKHPVSTSKKVDKYFVIVIVVEKDGLNICLTRSVYFGNLPEYLAERQNIVNHLEANYYYSSLPGVKLNEILRIGKELYKKYGVMDDWKKHPQGGIIGYTPREVMATSDCGEILRVDNILGWNPTVEGAIAEDMIVVKDGMVEQFTIDKRWPFAEIEVGSQKYFKPLILQL